MERWDERSSLFRIFNWTDQQKWDTWTAYRLMLIDKWVVTLDFSITKLNSKPHTEYSVKKIILGLGKRRQSSNRLGLIGLLSIVSPQRRILPPIQIQPRFIDGHQRADRWCTFQLSAESMKSPARRRKSKACRPLHLPTTVSTSYRMQYLSLLQSRALQSSELQNGALAVNCPPADSNRCKWPRAAASYICISTIWWDGDQSGSTKVGSSNSDWIANQRSTGLAGVNYSDSVGLYQAYFANSREHCW